MRRLAVWMLLGSMALWAQLAQAQDTSLPGQAPLVRCRRPVCTMYCPHGFHTDNTGCEVCQCLDDPCDTKEEEEKKCNEPWQITSTCMPGSCTQHPCTKLPFRCVEEEPEPQPCAMPMCENQCPNGYALDKNGCMTCRCKPQSCEEHECEDGTVCEARLELCDDLDCPIVPVCKARPLCMEAQGMWDMMRERQPMGHGMMGDMPMMGHMGRGDGGHMRPRPMCDHVTGHFKPMQCQMGMLGRCWCVDDRGLEIPGTRADKASINCAHNHTVSLDLHMQMQHEMNNIEEHFEELQRAMREQMSKWMMMDEEWITVVEIKQVSPTEEEVHVVQIHVVVLHDGETDLPSAANFLRRQMQMGRCQVPFQGQFLAPTPDSFQIHHKFEVVQPPELPEQPIIDGDEEPEIDIDYPEPVIGCWATARNYYSRHRMPIIIGSVGLIIFLTVLISLTITAIKRRRMAAYQFSHRRLENMDNFRKNLVLSSELDLTVDPVTGEKKKPPTSDLDVIPVQEEKVSLA